MRIVQVCCKIRVVHLIERFRCLAIGFGVALPCLGRSEKAVRARRFSVLFFFFSIIPCRLAIRIQVIVDIQRYRYIVLLCFVRVRVAWICDLLN
jgi:hypothetical protein